MGGPLVFQHFLGVPEAPRAIPDLARVQRLPLDQVSVFNLFLLQELRLK